MVAAYFRFPLCVYALTTARSTGTPQISDDYRGIEFEAVAITSSSSPPLSGSRILDRNSEVSIQQPNMPSQEAGSNPAPGPSSGATERQAQDAQGAGPTSPPRTEQELVQVRTRKSMSSPSKSSTVNLALGYFPQPRVRISPAGCLGRFRPPVRGAPFDFSQDPEVYCTLQPCPTCSSTSTVVAPLNGALSAVAWSPGLPPLHRVPAYIMCYAMCNFQPLANK